MHVYAYTSVTECMLRDKDIFIDCGQVYLSVFDFVNYVNVL